MLSSFGLFWADVFLIYLRVRICNIYVSCPLLMAAVAADQVVNRNCEGIEKINSQGLFSLIFYTFPLWVLNSHGGWFGWR